MHWDGLSHRIGLKLISPPEENLQQGVRIALRFMDPVFMNSNEQNLYIVQALDGTISLDNMPRMARAMKAGLRKLRFALIVYVTQW